jgi:hypothetical protein
MKKRPQNQLYFHGDDRINKDSADRFARRYNERNDYRDGFIDRGDRSEEH